MAKVDWITWKTSPNEIINPDKIIEMIEENFDNYSCYMKSVVYEGIDSEVISGGLDSMSLNVMGNSPANEKAVNILNSINEIENKITSLKSKIYDSLNEQKKIEKQQLIEAIEGKIEREKKVLDNTIALKDKIKTPIDTLNTEKVDDIIDVSTQRINKLKERLEIAKAL